MAIALRGVRTGKKGPSGQHLVVLVPSEAVALDQLRLYVVVHAGLDGSDYTLTPPEGDDWTLVDERTEHLAGQGRRRIYGWRRKMAAGDDTWTFLGAGTPCPVTWAMLAFTGASDSAGAADTNGSSTNTMSHVAPEVATGANNSVIVCVWSEEASPGSGNTPPGSMDHVASTRKAGSGGFGACEIGVMMELITSAGATGTRTLTAAASLTFVALTEEIPDSAAPQTIEDAGGLQAVASIGVPKVTGDVVLSTAEAALEQEGADLFPAVVLQPWDRGAGATTTLRYSPAPRFIPSTGTHAKKPFKARGATVVSLKRSLLAGGRIGGLGLPSAGDIKLFNPDGRLDGLLGFAWDDRDVEIRMVGSNRYGAEITWDDGFKLFRGRTVAPSDGFTEIALKIADLAKRLERPAQELTFAGTGGLEGPPELRGKRKPLCLGNVPSITPVCVDKANQIWVFSVDVNGTGGTAVDTVYVGANVLSPDDYTVTLGAVNRVQINTSIGDVPVALDVRMRATAPPAAELLEYLLLLGVAGSAQRDLWAFARHAALAPGGSGWYVTGDETVGQVAAALLGPNGYLDVDADGKFVIGHWRDPSIESPDHELLERNVLAIEPVSVQPPYWRQRLAYRRNFAQLTPDQVVEAARATPYGIYATEPYLLVELANEDALEVEPNAPETDPSRQSEWITALLDEFDANLLAASLWAMYSRPWECYRVAVDRRGYCWRLGQVVRLTHSRFGLGSGKHFRVAEMEITDAGVTAILWGLRGAAVLAYDTGELLDMGDGSLLEFG